MNNKTAVLVFGVLAVIASESYAWNNSPTAVLIVREYVIRGNKVPLDGRGSYDLDSGDYIAKYEWDFNDINDDVYDYNETPNCYPDGAFDGVTTTIYDTNGTYTVKLRVRDNHGAPDTYGCDVSVGSDNLHFITGGQL